MVRAAEAKADWFMYTEVTREEVKLFIKSERHFRDHLHSAFKALSRNSSRARNYYKFLKDKGVL